MRYIDTARSVTGESVASWLMGLDPAAVRELRVQSGFFSSDALSYIRPVVDELALFNGVLKFVIGSNQGMTTLKDVTQLIESLGPDRSGLSIAVVRYGNAFFHPKSIHLRTTMSSVAYVGSANFTVPGLGGLHSEAGLLLSTNEGDPIDTLDEIASGTDAWFEGSPAGVTYLDNTTDLNALVANGTLTAASPRRLNTSGGATGSLASHPKRSLPTPPPGSKALTRTVNIPEVSAVVDVPVVPPAIAAKWSKELSASDAQRKRSGNQRGSITLVRAGHPIDAQRWFRDALFAPLAWQTSATQTGKALQVAELTAHTVVHGVDRGILKFPLSHEPSRESGQNNYATLLHLGDLSADFQSVDFSGDILALIRLADGNFSLTIG